MNEIDEKDLEGLSHRETVMFALFCAKQVIHLIESKEANDCINIVELYLKGKATKEDCKKAARSAWAAEAAWAAGAAARAARAGAAWAAARAARAGAAWAAWAAAWAAEAAAEAAEAAAEAAARAAEAAAWGAAEAAWGAAEAAWGAVGAAEAAAAEAKEDKEITLKEQHKYLHELKNINKIIEETFL